MTKPSLYARRPKWLGSLVLAAVGLMAAGSAATVGAAGAPCAACAAVVIAPGQALALPGALNGLVVLVRVAPAEARLARAGLDEIAARGGRPGLLVNGVPAEPLDSGAVDRSGFVLIDAGTAASSAAGAFLLKQRIVEVRGRRPDAAVGIATVGPLPPDLEPYVDFVLAGEVRGKPAWRRLESSGGDPVASMLDPARDEAERWLWAAPADAFTLRRVVEDLARAARWLPAGLIPSPEVRVTCGGVPMPAYLNPETLETVALAAGCAPDAPVAARPAQAAIDRTTLSDGMTLIRVPAPGGSGRFAADVRVLGARALSVAEIVARHQAAAARQASIVRSLIAAGTLTLTFEAPGFAAPIVITSETVIYAAGGRTDLEQRAIRVNGIALRGRGVPRLPIIEPERVAAAPLAIALTDGYRYRLDGRDRIRGTPCYVVAFEPVDTRAPRFRGRAWIAADDFGMVRVSAVQTGLRGPIVSSEQTDDFTRRADGVWLLARSDTRQLYEGAAHRTPIHRVLVLESHAINPLDFDARLHAAWRSESVMLRETSKGYRYLRRDSPKAGTASSEPAVAPPATHVRTAVAGVILDPDISVPLPFAGLSYVDFDWFGTGAQLDAFFGGTYGQLAFALPSLGGTRWQLAARAFGIASSYNDRAFVHGREIYEQDIRQRPARASAWLVHPVGARASIRIGYDLDYTRFTAGEATASTFAVPPGQLVHGVRVAFDVQRAGWQTSVWWNPARRSGWRAWGPPGGEYRPNQRDFQRYGVTLERSALLRPGLTGRVEGAVASGHDLDRFSRFAFDAFDNRLRGYPAALIRYDRGAVLRSSMAWAASRYVRVDLFGDSALVRDPGFGRTLRTYTGVGAALEAPVPFGTLLAIEWGYGFRGVTAAGHMGTQVVRITGYKVF